MKMEMVNKFTKQSEKKSFRLGLSQKGISKLFIF